MKFIHSSGHGQRERKNIFLVNSLRESGSRGLKADEQRVRRIYSKYQSEALDKTVRHSNLKDRVRSLNTELSEISGRENLKKKLSID